MNDDDFMDSLEKVSEILEEPIGNSNAIYNYILSKNIKEKLFFVEMVEMKFLLGMINTRSEFSFLRY